MIKAGIANAFAADLAQAEHNLTQDELRLALYEDGADIDPAMSAYTTDGEISGDGYTAGGAVINTAVQSEKGLFRLMMGDVSWAGAFFSAAGGVIYNASNANKVIAVIDFGGVEQATNEEFLVRLGKRPIEVRTG